MGRCRLGNGCDFLHEPREAVFEIVAVLSAKMPRHRHSTDPATAIAKTLEYEGKSRRNLPSQFVVGLQHV